MSSSPAKSADLRIPSYRLHRPTGLAVVSLSGRDHYLGKHGTSESRAEYDRLVQEWLVNGRRSIRAAADDLSVNEMLVPYLEHADLYYRHPDGTPTTEADSIRYALRQVQRLYGSTLARDFGPRALEVVRGAMIREKLSRRLINKRIARVKQAFKWAVAKEIVPPSVLHGLQAVAGLRAGRSDAREKAPIGPVPEANVEATLPYLAPPLAAMVRVQLATGMRPGEATAMRVRDLDMTGAAWTYRPAQHKTAHHGIERTIFLGPRAQGAVRPFLKLDRDAFLFSPADAVAWRNEEKRRNRKSPLTPSQRARRPKRNPVKAPGERYEAAVYARAIGYAAERAGVPHWHPNQLRHAAATKLRREHGLDVAKAILGHRLVETTQVYAEIDAAKAAEIMARVG